MLVVELPPRQVDGNAQCRQTFALPGHVLRTHGLQHPVADRHDQSGLLGQRDEFCRCDDTQVRVVPAQQRLGAGNGSGLEVELGQILQQEFPAADGTAQFVLQHAPFQRCGSEAAGEEAVIVLAFLFGSVHRGIRAFHQCTLGFPISRVNRDADAGADAAFLIEQLHRPGQGKDDRRCHGIDVLELGGVQAQHDEFIAAEPCHHVAGPHALAQAHGGLLQQCVTGLVAQRVVDHFEMIQIDEQHRKARVLVRAADQCIQPLTQECPVGQLGERVVGRQVTNALIGDLALRYVATDAHDPDHVAGVVEQWDLGGRYVPHLVAGSIQHQFFTIDQGLTGAQNGLLVGEEALGHFPREEVKIGLADQVGGSRAHASCDQLIAGNEAALRVLGVENGGNKLDHRAQQDALALQRRLQRPALGDLRIAFDAAAGRRCAARLLIVGDHRVHRVAIDARLYSSCTPNGVVGAAPKVAAACSRV